MEKENTIVSARFHRECSNCHIQTTALRQAGDGHKYYCWKKDGNGGYYCYNCYCKLVDYPRRRKYYKTVANPRTRSKWSKHRINIKGIDRKYDMRIERKGVCLWCKKSVASGQIKRTNLHHRKYHSDYMKDITEICVGCHSKYTHGHVCDIMDKPVNPNKVIGSTNGPWSISNIARLRNRKINRRKVMLNK